MKNWKSTIAFICFIITYIVTVINGAPAAVIDTTGNIALYSSLFMMFRNDVTTSLLEKMVDKINKD